MGWSALWGSIASILTIHLNSSSSANSDDNSNRKHNYNNDHFLKESLKNCGTQFEQERRYDKSFQTIARPIAERIAEKVILNILNYHGIHAKDKESILNKIEIKIYKKAVRMCIQICTLLSDAYMQVPRTMLYNAQKSHRDGKNIVSKKSEFIWKLWCSHYKLDERVEELKDYTGGIGRLGLIVPYHREMNVLREDDDYLS